MTDETFDFADMPTGEDAETTNIFNQDFSLEDDYKPPPLIPQGNYQGNVTNVTVDGKSHAILWHITLEGNGGFQSDGETPIDGQIVWLRNWMPKASDVNKMIKSGSMTKRQWKINALADFAKEMQINMNSRKEIIKGIKDGKWIGIRVLCTVDIDEYLGNVRNVVNRMKSLEEKD